MTETETETRIDSIVEKLDVIHPEPHKSELVLSKLAVENDLSQQAIADYFDVTQATISYWIKKHGLLDGDDGKVLLIEGDDLSVTFRDESEISS